MRALSPLPGQGIAVVGGCGGIGRAVVEAAMALGMRCVVLDLPVSIEAAPPEVPAIPLDVTDPASVAAAMAELPRHLPALHALVNLAGYAAAKVPVAEVDPAVWSAVIDANLTGAFRVAAAAMPLLRAAATPEAPSAIVHAASGLATRLLPGFGPYGAAKAGLIALTKSLAIENAPLVRANCVAPGAVRTAFLGGGTGRPHTPQHLDEAAYNRAIPMGRIAVADDVAGPILFLCAPASAYITGQTLWINGGGLTP